MCFIPPQCLFCKHLMIESGDLDGPDCKAFEEIPSEIFRGIYDHSDAYEHDGGFRFELNVSMKEEFLEINELRLEAGMVSYKAALELDKN